MRRILRVATLSLLFGLGIAQGQAVVEGRVLNPDGLPAPGSSVEAFPVQEDGFAGTVSWTQVDDKGNFRLALPRGRYEIRAKNEPEGYPDPNSLLSADPGAIFPEVSVGALDIEGLRIKLGPKGGVLDGIVRDRATHAPIPKAKVTIRDVDRPQAFVEVFTDAAGRFRLTVPRRPLLISATGGGT